VALHWMLPESWYMHFFLLLMLVLQPISLLRKLRRLQKKKQGLIRKVKLILSFLMRIRHQYM
jgi:UDP-N-acetylmuramyl pentapeptide phosphotransferase/UDP-N-acetylglucosamine-1-phosphate transferase